MSNQEQPMTWWGALLMPWLLILAIAATAIPMLIGVAIIAYVPWIGELRSLSPVQLLHFLWMYPAIWVAGVIIDPIVKYSFNSSFARAIGNRVGDIAMWLLLSCLYMVFFRDSFGALLAALISFLLMKVFVEWLERHPHKKDQPSGNN